MIQYDWPVSLSPGNEQAFRFGSEAAVTDGSFNYAGVKSDAVDAMIRAMLEAEDETDFVAAVRALDRLLLSGDYVVPLFHLPTQWVAYWRRLQRPEKTPLYGYQFDTWWAEPTAAGGSARPSPDGTMSSLAADTEPRRQRPGASLTAEGLLRRRAAQFPTLLPSPTPSRALSYTRGRRLRRRARSLPHRARPCCQATASPSSFPTRSKRRSRCSRHGAPV